MVGMVVCVWTVCSLCMVGVVVGEWSVCGRYGGRRVVGMVVGVRSVWWLVCGRCWWSVCGLYGGQCVVGMVVGMVVSV